MRFGEFIRSKRLNLSITLRSASIATGIPSHRLSEIEREVTETGPTNEELGRLQKVYNLESFSCKPYSFDKKRSESEQAVLQQIKTKTPEELLAVGIFACKTNTE